MPVRPLTADAILKRQQKTKAVKCDSFDRTLICAFVFCCRFRMRANARRQQFSSASWRLGG
jgi:hypothetical protein